MRTAAGSLVHALHSPADALAASGYRQSDVDADRLAYYRCVRGALSPTGLVRLALTSVSRGRAGAPDRP